MNYHRHVSAKATFEQVDHEIWQALWRWAKRRHPQKGSRWIRQRYFHSIGSASWAFAVDTGNGLDTGEIHLAAVWSKPRRLRSDASSRFERKPIRLIPTGTTTLKNVRSSRSSASIATKQGLNRRVGPVLLKQGFVRLEPYEVKTSVRFLGERVAARPSSYPTTCARNTPWMRWPNSRRARRSEPRGTQSGLGARGRPASPSPGPGGAAASRIRLEALTNLDAATAPCAGSRSLRANWDRRSGRVAAPVPVGGPPRRSTAASSGAELTPEPVVKLAPERKHLTNLIKMVAYQAESDLLRSVAPHYRRVEDEGRTLIQFGAGQRCRLKVTARNCASRWLH